MKKTLEQKCAFKQLIEHGNSNYLRYSFKANSDKTIKCLSCNGYHPRKECYKTLQNVSIKEVYKKQEELNQYHTESRDEELKKLDSNL